MQLYFKIQFFRLKRFFFHLRMTITLFYLNLTSPANQQSEHHSYEKKMVSF